MQFRYRIWDQNFDIEAGSRFDFPLKEEKNLEVESLEYLTWDFWDKLGHQGHWNNTESIEDIETPENIPQDSTWIDLIDTLLSSENTRTRL